MVPMTTAGYRTQARDTSIDAELFQFDLLRAMGPAGRADLLDAMCRSVREMSDIGTRLRYPNATERELLLRFAAHHLDREKMVAAYGWDPDGQERP